LSPVFLLVEEKLQPGGYDFFVSRFSAFGTLISVQKFAIIKDNA
jgi:hypothetical protein